MKTQVIVSNERKRRIITRHDVRRYPDVYAFPFSSSKVNYMKDNDIPLYIIGISKNDPSVGLIRSKFDGVLRRLQKVYSKIKEARITVKKLRTKGQKQCYEVFVLVITSSGKYTYSETGWDLSNICEMVGQKLLRNLSKQNNKRLKTSIRKVESKIF